MTNKNKAQAQAQAQAQEQTQAQAQAQQTETKAELMAKATADIANLVDATTALAADPTLYDGNAKVAFDNGSVLYRDLGGKLETVKVVASADGKQVVTITDTAAIMEYDRLAFLKSAGKASGYGVCKELAKAAESGLYKHVGKCKTVQEYAHKFFGFSTSTANFYIRVANAFIDEIIGDDGKSRYKVKPPFEVYDIATAHLQELLPVYEMFKDSENPLLEVYNWLKDHEIDIEVSAASLRAKIKDALSKQANEIVGGIKAIGEAGTDAEVEKEPTAEAETSGKKVSDIDIAKKEIFDSAAKITEILQKFGKELYGENIDRILSALQLMLTME